MLKYLLCRPMGGWNDLLCQINLCYHYSRIYNRVLVIDTNHISGIQDHFSNYFSFDGDNSMVFLSLSNDLIEIFSGSTIKNLTNGSYVNMESNEWFHDKTNKITFDMSSDSDDHLLVHQSSGGGAQSIYFLRNLILENSISEAARAAYYELKKLNYCSTLVRNTDYKTDYVSFFSSIEKSVCLYEKILVGSDDKACLDYASDFFGDKFMSLSELPDANSGRPLISNYYGMDFQIKHNKRSLMELVVISLSSKFFVSEINFLKNTPLPTGMKSGYVMLADNLNKDKSIFTKLIDWYK
jgi:hypothetical protein